MSKLVEVKDKISLSEFFNPFDIEHIKAYKYLYDNGCWKPGFIPSYVVVDGPWQILIMQKLANAYIFEKLANL